MTISLFRTLVAISETSSFSGAAEKVHVTHAAVGQQMKRLEALLNVVLFDRSEKTPKLNQLGKALVVKAKDVILSYETILDDLTGDPRMIGDLSLGAIPSTIRGLIPMSLKRLVETYPDLNIRVVSDMSPNLFEQIERGSLDAAVLSEPKRIPRNLNWMPFYEEELMLLTSPEVTETDPLRILATMPYIRHTRQSAVGQLAEEWLSANKVIVRDTMEMGSLENLASMVTHNLGVTVGPNICVPDPIFQGLRKIPLGPTAVSRTLGVMTRADCSKIKLVQHLFEQIVLTLKEHETKPIS